jgi:hypothetical protein
MKLLYCTECHDIFKLGYNLRACKCGESQGRYLEDGLHAEIKGEFAMCLGFANSTFVKALERHAETPEGQPPSRNRGPGYGWQFEAFVIPEPCPTVKRLT